MINRQQSDPVKVPLASKPLGVWATAMAVRRNVLEVIPAMATREPIISSTSGPRWHMVMDPAALRRILKERFEDYPKSVNTRLILSPAIGDSLLLAEGPHWRWQRRAAAPAFAHRNVEALGPLMTAAAEASCRRLEVLQGPIDLLDEMVAATFAVISAVTFSGDGTFDSKAVHQALDAYIAKTAKLSLMDVMGLPASLPRPGRLFSGPGLRRMKTVADEVITSRAQGARREPPDFLDLLLDAHDPETGRAMTRNELRDNLLTFILAGHETTALALAWALYLCAFDLVVQERAADEAHAALGDRAATAGDLAALPQTMRIINEALRLYPPAAFLSRTALGGNAHHDPGEDAIVAPAPPTVIQRLRRTIFPRRVAPSQPVAIDENYTAEHAPIINTRLAMAFGKEGPKACHLRVRQPEKVADGSGILAEPGSCRAFRNNGFRT